MSLLRRYEGPFVNVLLITSIVVFLVGIWAPILTLKKLIFVKNTFSVLSGITQLAQDGHHGLFLIIGIFTLVLPAIKIGLLCTVWNVPGGARSQERFLGWLSAIGKWSMLDVFVVAVIIASVKLGSLATIEVHYGLYVFAAAVILIMINTQVVYLRVREQAGR